MTEQTASDAWDELSRRWREVYDTQTELAKGWVEGQAQLVNTLVGAGASTDPAGDAAAMADAWRSSMALGSLLSRGLPGTGGGPGGDTGAVASEMLGRMFNPMSMTLVGGSQVGDVIRRMTEGPRFADVGTVERRMAEVMSLYVAVQTATRSYESVVANAWSKANQRFATEVAERQRSGTQFQQAKDALAVWMDIANKALQETHRSPEFLTAQRELLRAAMDYLIAERGLVEQFLDPAGLPTRSEIDEVHRSVQQLKRRVRALERGGGGATVRPRANTVNGSTNLVSATATASKAAAKPSAGRTTARKSAAKRAGTKSTGSKSTGTKSTGTKSTARSTSAAAADKGMKDGQP